MFDLLAYVLPDKPPAELRDAIAARHGGRVALRMASAWGGEVEPCRRVLAPGFPAIARAYAAAGIPVLDDDAPAPPSPAAPRKLALVDLPPAPVVSVVCAGPHLPETLKAVTPVGLVLAVNYAASDVKADLWLALDGFARLTAAQGDPIQCCPKSAATTVGHTRWLDTDGPIPEGTGIYTTTAALRLAQQLGAQVVHLIGHEGARGRGHRAHNIWGSSEAADLRRQVQAQIEAMRAAGITVHHYRPDGSKA
jgi:hypothetical protein